MTHRARILYCFVLACLALTISSVCRSQGRAAQPANALARTANQADVEAAVALLCKPAEVTRSNTGNIAGCKTCPKGTDFFGEGTGDWNFSGSMVGHFRSAHENNLFIDGANCDSHASNWGGSFLFSINSGGFQLLRYDQGLHIDDCHKFPFADGREFLVCRGGWSGQGYNDSSVFLARFDSTGKDTEALVFTTSDATATCGDDPSVKVPSSGIKEIKFSSKDSGELTGMTITAAFGQVTCGEVNAKRSPGKEMPSVKIYELHYSFDGKQFAIALESKAALNKFPQK
ncbi:MAG TPA: hypothetical protein VIH72_04605 [Candidatus Acidoferrales bacterium]